jgi:hypothetical protein
MTEQATVRLHNEAEAAEELLRGKCVAHIARTRPRELMVQFTDGYRLHVNASVDGLDVSITAGLTSSLEDKDRSD